MVKKPQLLRVVIGDRVEIGANTCVDRGSWRDTTIGSDTKARPRFTPASFQSCLSPLNRPTCFLRTTPTHKNHCKLSNAPQIDNLVQVAHNVHIGRNCLVCGQAGLAGSATLGDFVVMGGRAAVADHVSVCSKVRGSGCILHWSGHAEGTGLRGQSC